MARVTFGPDQPVFKGKIFEIIRRDVRFPNGDADTFEFCKRPNSVFILPFDAKGRLLLTREHRHGRNEKVYFLPAGRMDNANETPLRAARRELREETGFDARIIKPVRRNSAGEYFIWNIYVFAARDLFPSPLQGDEHFSIEVVPVSLAKAVNMARDGTIKSEFVAYNIIRFHYMLKSGQFRW